MFDLMGQEATRSWLAASKGKPSPSGTTSPRGSRVEKHLGLVKRIGQLDPDVLAAIEKHASRVNFG
jgi:hypothetical protein